MLLSERTDATRWASIRDLTPRPLGSARCTACIRSDQRVAAAVAPVLPDRLRPGEEYVLRALDAHIRRAAARDPAHHWRRPPDDRSQPHRPRRSSREQAWRQRLFADAGPRGRSATFQRVDKALRPRYFTDRGLDSLVELHRGLARGDHRPHPRAAGAGVGIDRGRQPAERRGSQPAVPKSRVRTAQARFRGSRGGQPPRLPVEPSGRRSYG